MGPVNFNLIFRSTSNNAVNVGKDTVKTRVSNSSLNDALAPLQKAEAFGNKKMPTELWQRSFEYFPVREIFKAKGINREIGACAEAFLVSKYLKSQSPDDFSKLQDFFARASKESSKDPWLNAFYQMVLSEKISDKFNIFELEKLFTQGQAKEPADRLAIAQKGGLLSNISEQELKNISPEHINYLASEQGLLEIIDLESQGRQFNLSAFLKIPVNLLNGGMKDAILGLINAGLNTDELLPDIFNLLSSVKTVPLNPALEKIPAIRNIAAMVQCGIFVNRIENSTDIVNGEPVAKGVTTLYNMVPFDEKLFFTRVLLAAGADPSRQNPISGNTPLHIYNLVKNPKIAQILLDGGANPNLQNCFGQVPIMIFSGKSKEGEEGANIVKMLLERGAKISIKDQLGSTAIHSAVYFDRQDVLEHLLNESNIEEIINIQDEEGRTPMHLAVEDDKEKIAGMLLNKGADVDTIRTSEDEGQKTVRELATSLERQNILRLMPSTMPSPR